MNLESKGKSGASGFTLIELVVVAAIIGILAAVAVGQYQRSIVRAKEATLHENLFVMRSAIHQYFADKGRYPADLQSLVDDEYLYRMPVDPVAQRDDSWVPTYSETGDEDDIGTEPGVMDVHSGAPGISPLEGTSYAEW